MKTICQELSAKNGEEKERSESGEEKSSKDLSFSYSPPTLHLPQRGITNAPYWEGASGAGAGPVQEVEGMVHRESCWEDPLSLGGEMGPGKECSLYHCCEEEDRRRQMHTSLGVWDRTWGSHHLILPSLAWHCSCAQQATHPPSHVWSTFLHFTALLSSFLFCLPFILSLHAEAYPDSEVYSIWDSLFKKKNAKIYYFGKFYKTHMKT